MLAAAIIMNVGRNFTQMNTSTFEATNDSTVGIVKLELFSHLQSVKSSIMKGFSFSIVNVALVANHIALITACDHVVALLLLVNPYHLIDYKKRYALFWGMGASVGMSTWFFILVNVLKSYRKTLKISSVVWVLNNLGSVLILIGIFSLFSILWSLV